MVLAIGALIITIGLYGMVAPARLLGLTALFKRPGGLWTAALIRVVLGLAMIVAAPASRLPLFLQIFGGLTVLAGVSIPILGSERVVRMIDWFLGGSHFAIRVWASIAALFGLFMVWLVW